MAFSPPEYCRLFARKKAYQGGVTGTPGPLPPSYALTTVMYTLDYQPLFGKMAGPGDGGNRAYVK